MGYRIFILGPATPISLWRADHSLGTSAFWLSSLSFSFGHFPPKNKLIKASFQCGRKSIVSLTWLFACTQTLLQDNSMAFGKLVLRHDLMVMMRKLNSPSLEASEE